MNGPDTMHPRELIRGLMRGDATDFKVGYGPDAAVHAADTAQRDVGGLTEHDKALLSAYADGFAHGMAEDRDRISPAGTRGGDR